MKFERRGLTCVASICRCRLMRRDVDTWRFCCRTRKIQGASGHWQSRGLLILCQTSGQKKHARHKCASSHKIQYFASGTKASTCKYQRDSSATSHRNASKQATRTVCGLPAVIDAGLFITYQQLHPRSGNSLDTKKNKLHRHKMQSPLSFASLSAGRHQGQRGASRRALHSLAGALAMGQTPMGVMVRLGMSDPPQTWNLHSDRPFYKNCLGASLMCFI